MLKSRISLPKQASAGDIITVKTLVSHPMETGFRRNALGDPIPRNILRDFICLYNNQQVFRAEFHPAVAANPFLSFNVLVDVSGTFSFQWREQSGVLTTVTRELTVTP